METKLTLKLNKAVVERAKVHAKKKKTSVSKLVENYLNRLTHKEKKEEIRISPLVKSVSGVLKDLPADYDFKRDYTEYLMRKYK